MSGKLKMVFLDAATLGEDVDLVPLKKFGTLTCYDKTLPEERIPRISGHEVVITNKVVIDKEVMDACPSLKLVCIAATGMNNVDLEYASQKDIEVKNVTGYSTESVAQSTFAMLLYLLHKMPYFNDYVKSGKYAKSDLFTHHGRSFWELKNKVFGIIGIGAIGSRVADLAATFGSWIIYYSTSGKNIHPIYKRVKFEELLKESDIISIHCPLNENTENLIGMKELKMMKKHAILINAGRGGIVNEVALADALNNNLIAAAGIDVLTKEPIAKDSPLLGVKDKEKLLITPHIAWISQESRKMLIQGIAYNISRYL